MFLYIVTFNTDKKKSLPYPRFDQISIIKALKIVNWILQRMKIKWFLNPTFSFAKNIERLKFEMPSQIVAKLLVLYVLPIDLLFRLRYSLAENGSITFFPMPSGIFTSEENTVFCLQVLDLFLFFFEITVLFTQ